MGLMRRARLVVGLVSAMAVLGSGLVGAGAASGVPVVAVRQTTKVKRLEARVKQVVANEIRVAWPKLKKKTTFRVEVFKDKKMTKRVFKKTTTKTAMWVRSAKVKENKKYYLRVKTVGRRKNLKSARLVATTGYRTPAVPQGLSVKPISPSEISLSWNPADLAKKYEIRLSKTPFGSPTWTARTKATAIESLTINPAVMGVGRLFFVRVASVRGTEVSAPTGFRATALLPPVSGPVVFTTVVGSYNVLRRDAKDGLGRSFYERVELLAKRIKKWEIAAVQETTNAMYEGARPVEVLAAQAGLAVSRDPVTNLACARHSDHVLYQAKVYALERCGEMSLVGDPTTARWAAWSVLTHQATGARVFVVGAHLTAGGGSGRNTIRLSQTDQMVKEIADLNSDTLPVILMGDLNEALIDAPVTVSVALANAGYAPTDLIATTRDNISSPTFHDFRKPSYVDARIDYIAISAQVSATHFGVVVESEKKAPSDHYPITATLEVH